MLSLFVRHLDRSPSIRLTAIALIALGANRSFAQSPEPQKAQPGLAGTTNATVMQVLDNSTVTEKPPTKEQCIVAHHECQEAQNDGRLITAREKAGICTNHTCPGLLVSDCARWKNEIDRRIPSVVFEVRLDGEVNSSAKIDVDGTIVDSLHPGEVLRLEPGKHTFRFVLEQHPPVVRTIMLGEGMQYRIVSAEFKSAILPAAQPTAPIVALTPPIAPKTERPVPMLVYPLLGVGALGLGGFAGFVLSGRGEYDRLAKTCSPNCTDSEVSSLRARYLMGNISLGLGLSALIGASTLYLTRPVRAVDPTVGFVTIPRGAMVTVGLRGF